jgi:hypothetical protein
VRCCGSKVAAVLARCPAGSTERTASQRLDESIQAVDGSMYARIHEIPVLGTRTATHSPGIPSRQIPKLTVMSVCPFG